MSLENKFAIPLTCPKIQGKDPKRLKRPKIDDVSQIRALFPADLDQKAK